MADKADSPTFSLAQTRHIVKDLFTPNPVIYWTDFLLSTIGGMICFGLVRRIFAPFSIEQALALIVCSLLFYRSVLFTHEMVHLRDKAFRGFRIAWNLLCGIPFLMPSFTYYTHVDHHMRKHYATKQDGEYLPLGTSSPWRIFVYLCHPFWLPIVAIVRFLFLAPISWFIPSFRDFVHRRASSMVMDPSYIRPLPTRKVLRIFRLQEALCFAWVASIAVLLATGTIPIGFLITAYLLSVTILFLNALRTLGAHRYLHNEGKVTFLQQLLDSVNHPLFLSALWAPVGLRFHALHHLFPSMPYHNLAQAHKRLMAQLPADSPYRLTVSSSLLFALMQLWRASRAANTQTRRIEPSLHPPHQTGAGQRLTGAH